MARSRPNSPDLGVPDRESFPIDRESFPDEDDEPERGFFPDDPNRSSLADSDLVPDEPRLEDLYAALGPVRSPPRQDRSRRRYWQILVSAAELFASLGYDATTMDAIASAASTSIGSVYRFFPNKPAIFRAVATFALAQIQAAVLEVMARAQQPGTSWQTLLDEVIDRLALAHRDDPAVRAMLANLQLYDEFAEQDQRLNAEFVSATSALLAAWAPTLVEPERKLVATMVVQTIAGILVLAQREPAALAEGMTAQLKLMLRRYLEPWLA